MPNPAARGQDDPREAPAYSPSTAAPAPTYSTVRNEMPVRHVQIRLFCSIFAFASAGCSFAFERDLEPGELRGRFVFAGADGVPERAAVAAGVSLLVSNVAVKTDAQGRF